jgi:hypothetical protein
VDREGVDARALQVLPIEAGMGRWRRGNPGQDAEVAARCVRHTGGAIVGDDPCPVEIVRPHCRQAGMRAGKYVHVGLRERVDAPVVLARITQRGHIEAPARERLGISVNDADARGADSIARDHRQTGKAREDIRMPRRRSLERRMNLVRAIDGPLIDPVGIGAAAAGIIRIQVKLRFDIAEKGIVPQHALVDLP